MFNFTTLTIFNTVKSVTVSEKGQKVPKDANLIIAEGDYSKPQVRIGNTRFSKDTILDITVKNHTVENLATVEFSIAKALTQLMTADTEATEAGSYRIVLYIGLSMNSQDSFYANDFVYKGKPLYIEFVINKGETSGDAEKIAKRIVNNAKKYFLLTAQDTILDVSADGETVKFTGVNGYQIIKKASLQKYNPNARTINCCGGDGDFEDILVGVPVVYTTDETGVVTTTEETIDSDGTKRALADNEVPIGPGIEAFGDYNWMIHNLRLPTLANTNIWAPTRTEQPVVGGNYTQIIVRLCVKRDGIAGEVVGQRATSVTTHVLYVLDNSEDGKGQTGNVKTVLDALKAIKPDEVSEDDVTVGKGRADSVLMKPYEAVAGTTSGDDDDDDDNGGE